MKNFLIEAAIIITLSFTAVGLVSSCVTPDVKKDTQYCGHITEKYIVGRSYRGNYVIVFKCKDGISRVGHCSEIAFANYTIGDVYCETLSE